MLPYSDLSHLSRPASVDVDGIRAKLRTLSDLDLIVFGKEMAELIVKEASKRRLLSVSRFAIVPEALARE